MPLRNQTRGAYTPSKYAPDEIRNSIILPLMKKGYHGRQTCNKIFCPPPLSCVLFPRGRKHFRGGEKCFAPSKRNSATDEKFSGYASGSNTTTYLLIIK